MTNFLNSINSVLWGLPMLLFFIFTALRFTVNMKFFQFHGLGKIFKTTIKSFTKKGDKNGISNFSAFCSVLGACLGTGNIVGVATAIHYGGPGAVFWMWVSAIFSMATSYAENFLGTKYRRITEKGKVFGGAFSYMENGLKMKGLSKVYALFFLFSSLGMGNLTQSNSLSDGISKSFHINKTLIGIIAAVIVLIIITGGIKRLGAFQTVLVPLMSFAWFILSFLVLFKFRENIIPSFTLIFKSAFSLKGIYGFTIYKAMRYGVSRGVFSNEAGLGSATILHAESKEINPKTQGILGMSEVFIDTVLMCTITAIVILVSTNYNDYTLFGAELSMKAYGTLGEIGVKGISLLTGIFSFTSLSSASFYGGKSLSYLVSDKLNLPFKIFYSVLVFVGAVTKPKIIWTIADIFNGLMAVPNLFAINCLSKEVESPT